MIDQLQEISCALYRRCKQCAGTYRALWQEMSALFRYVKFENWEKLYWIMGKIETLDSS